MVSCGQFTMLSMAPSSVMSVPPSSKPKIGFSIDSIVGSGELRGHGQDSNLSSRSNSPDRPTSSLSDYNYPLELRYNDSAHQLISRGQASTKIDQPQSTKTTEFHKYYTTRLPEPSPNSQDALDKRFPGRHSPPPANRAPVSPATCNRPIQRTPSPPIAHHQPTLKGPIVVPGIPAGVFRPFPVQAPNISDVKPVPAYLNSPEMVGPHNPHFLAQFQMAAALAHGQSQGFSPGPGLPQHHPQFNNPNVVRESYPLYPWLISRHGRIFPHRFPGNFLLQPFRKPKRVRTAFSPSQLLKLEHAFESNHYVVGAERKTLAQALSLTETQVKVWFQNRRTKHKRMQQEEDAKNGGNGSGNGSGGNGNDGDHNSPGDHCSNTQVSFDDDEEDELIDMDDCPSDQEGDLVQ